MFVKIFLTPAAIIYYNDSTMNNENLDKSSSVISEKNFGKYFLLILFIFALVSFLSVIRIFILQIVMAAVFATLFHPLYRRLSKLLWGRKGIGAFITCIIILLGILIPFLFISKLVLHQGIELYHTAQHQLKAVVEKGDAGFLGTLKNSTLGQWIDIYDIDWKSTLNDVVSTIGTTLAHIITKTSRATLKGVLDLFIILFSIFYFLRDGDRILVRIKNIVPINEKYKDMIIERFSSMSNATVKGILLIALLQSFLATITLWAFGVKAWLLWGVVMLVLSVIPFVGSGAVLVPTGIIKVIAGHTFQGVAIIVISLLFISMIDNFLRPRLVGYHAGMHDLVVFFSMLGGISAFGPSGFIIGPLIAAIFLTVLDIYNIEFQEHLKYSKKTSDDTTRL